MNKTPPPFCPYCEKPTVRRIDRYLGITDMYFPPVYDENNVNINPDRNISKERWLCNNCEQTYIISGNDATGFEAFKESDDN